MIKHFTHRNAVRVVMRGFLTGIVSIGALVGLGAPAHADGRYIVTERDGFTNTGIRLNAGERVQISAGSAQIWSGVIFSGLNGPNGWTSRCNTQCPLPAARAYSLLVQIGSTHYYVGSGTAITTTESGEVILKINDDVRGNGSGYFEADVTKAI